MNARQMAAMAEATRLTRQGRLAEAEAALRAPCAKAGTSTSSNTAMQSISSKRLESG